ncbi:MAG: hypothetical protein J6X49_03085 [Victivallales bacterium]|nr:hypothetical protein [Victivallales bacterium]
MEGKDKIGKLLALEGELFPNETCDQQRLNVFGKTQMSAQYANATENRRRDGIFLEKQGYGG